MKFYKCDHCGNVIDFMNASGVPVVCCGEQMKELIPGTTDGAAEKHVPVIAIDGAKVTVLVGEVAHPMTEEHYIQWIDIQTSNGIQRVELTPSYKPEATFAIDENEDVVAVYEYCNLHGLWKA